MARYYSRRRLRLDSYNRSIRPSIFGGEIMMALDKRWSDFHNSPIKYKLEITLVILTFMAVIFTIGLLVFWSVYPYKTIVVKNPKMEKKVVYQGEITNYSTDYVKWMETDSVHRFFVDGLIFDAGTINPIRPVGAGHGVQPVQIPRTLPPGKFKPNPIREIKYEFWTDEFLVKASSDADEEFDSKVNQEKE
jgi:hypothetical protein